MSSIAPDGSESRFRSRKRPRSRARLTSGLLLHKSPWRGAIPNQPCGRRKVCVSGVFVCTSDAPRCSGLRGLEDSPRGRRTSGGSGDTRHRVCCESAAACAYREALRQSASPRSGHPPETKRRGLSTGAPFPPPSPPGRHKPVPWSRKAQARCGRPRNDVHGKRCTDADLCGAATVPGNASHGRTSCAERRTELAFPMRKGTIAQRSSCTRAPSAEAAIYTSAELLLTRPPLHPTKYGAPGRSSQAMASRGRLGPPGSVAP